MNKHKEWKSIYIEKPQDGETCACRIAEHEPAYVSGVTWNAKENRFETIKMHSNRIEVIIWKCDEWSPEVYL